MNKLLEIAGSYVGETEIKGAQDNPKIVAMFKKSGNAWVEDDETPWCAAFVGAVLDDAGTSGTMKLNARSYLDWGTPVDVPEAGDIAILWRGEKDGWQGHVAFYVRDDGKNVKLLGGNQGDAVTIKSYAKSRVLGYRRATLPNPHAAKGKIFVVATVGVLGPIALWWEEFKAAIVGLF